MNKIAHFICTFQKYFIPLRRKRKKKGFDMDAVATRTMSFSIPVKDVRLATGLARKMGWTIVPQPRQRKSSYERSREDIEAGRVYTYASLDDLIKEIEG